MKLAAIAIIFFLGSTIPIEQLKHVPAAYAQLNQWGDLCNAETLPRTVQSHLQREFASWRIQKPTDLGSSALKRWESEKPAQCPGIAAGRFENNKAFSYAVLLVSQVQADAGYQFVVFSPKAGQPAYDVKVLDSSERGASSFFIHSVPLNKFFHNESRRKFQVYTREGILLVDAAGQEYEADVYFWANGKYQHQPIDY